MIERPILFNDAMVRAILDGRKTQTRRVVKPHKAFVEWGAKGPDDAYDAAVDDDGQGFFLVAGDHGYAGPVPCPYGKPGDRLWVRESARVIRARGAFREAEIEYQADRTEAIVPYPSRLAPAPVGKLLANGTYREASRITLEIADVRVERLQEISEADALAEGVETTRRAVSPSDTVIAFKDYLNPGAYHQRDARASFSSLWSSINGPESWGANPWVWVVEFRRMPC